MGNASVGRLAARILYNLASAYSPSGSEAEAARVLASEAEELGLEAVIDSVGNVHVNNNTGSKPLVGLVSHIDTVEGFIEPVLTSDTVYGRGVVDAKGPVAAMLVALTMIDKNCPTVLMALVDEEGGSIGARSIIENNMVPPYVIIGEPTGSTRVAIGYHGGFKASITCTGYGGHPANPEGSALDTLLDLLAEARRALEKTGAHFNITMLQAGESPRKLPEKAMAVIDVRVDVGGSARGSLEVLKSLVLGRNCSITPFHEPTEPVKVKPQDPVPRALARALISQGVKPEYTVKKGTSDMNLLAPFTRSIAAYGPGDPRLAHTDKEKVTVEELELAVETYKRAVEYLCKNNSS